MSTLPKALRYAPYAFYAVALIAWIFTIWTNWIVLQSQQEFPQVDPDRAAQLAAIIKSEPFVRGFIDAAYMVANGAIVHMLIAVYDRLGLARETVG